MIKNLPSVDTLRLCPRCKDIIKWKKQYRKYKMLKHIRKCDKCFEFKIRLNYHVICQDCAIKYKQCAKCLVSIDLIDDIDQVEVGKNLNKSLINDIITQYNIINLKERQQRSLDRHLNQKTCTIDVLIRILKITKNQLTPKLLELYEKEIQYKKECKEELLNQQQEEDQNNPNTDDDDDDDMESLLP